MRKRLAVLTAMAVASAGLLAVRDAEAGCACSGCTCVYSSLNTIRCECSGLICSMGPGYKDCPKLQSPVAGFDGTVSDESRQVAIQAKRAVLSRRGCDGSVVSRQYTVAAVKEMHQATALIRV